MIQAKKFTRAEQAHCHSWEVGWAIMRAARGVKQRAFAYGYLTHLASDVFSHNHYVPMQLVTSFRAPGMRHIYWEVHFDTLQATPYREVLSEVRNHSFPECDALVEEVVGRTLFSFQTDKRIFDSFVAIQDMNQWQRLMSGFAARSPHQLPAGTVEEYNTACLTSILDLLQRGKRSACQQDDPIGLDALREARQTRRNVHLLVSNSSAPAHVILTLVRLSTAHPFPVPAIPT